MDAHTPRNWLVFVPVLASLALSGCGDRLEDYVSKEGRFRVRMPGQPERDKDSSLPEGVNKVTLLQRSGKYEIAWQDLELKKKLSDEKRLDNACAVALKLVKGKDIGQKEIWLGDYPGRELVIELTGGEWIVHDRMYLVEGRLYHVMASGAKWWVKSSESKKVLDSFALLEE